MSTFLLTCTLTFMLPFDPIQPWRFGITDCAYETLWPDL